MRALAVAPPLLLGCLLVQLAACSLVLDANPAAILESTRERCTDGIDNDGNGRTDCEDLACRAAGFCAERTFELCTDGIDDDGNGRVDCHDPKCFAVRIHTDGGDAPLCHEDCGNGIDDDDNGLTDCADPDCAHEVSCLEGAQDSSCSDGEDNDRNGLVDCADFSCARQPVCCHQRLDSVLLTESFAHGQAATDLVWSTFGLPSPTLSGGRARLDARCGCQLAGLVTRQTFEIRPGAELRFDLSLGAAEDNAASGVALTPLDNPDCALPTTAGACATATCARPPDGFCQAPQDLEPQVAPTFETIAVIRQAAAGAAGAPEDQVQIQTMGDSRTFLPDRDFQRCPGAAPSDPIPFLVRLDEVALTFQYQVECPGQTAQRVFESDPFLGSLPSMRVVAFGRAGGPAAGAASAVSIGPIELRTTRQSVCESPTAWQRTSEGVLAPPGAPAVADPSVVEVAGSYFAMLHGTRDAAGRRVIGLASSTDARDWSRETATFAYHPNQGEPAALFEPAVACSAGAGGAGRLLVLFARDSPSGIDATCAAGVEQGLTGVRFEAAPHPVLPPRAAPGAFDSAATFGPTVLVRDEPGRPRYRIWYAAIGTPPFSEPRIGYAEADDALDPGSYRRRDAPVLTGGPDAFDAGGASAPTVLWDESRQIYRMWYAADGADGVRRIGYAVSPDGIAWHKLGDAVLGPGGEVELGGPSALQGPGDARLRLWFTSVYADGHDEIGAAINLGVP